MVTPTRLVAPIGNEVVLLAGICGPNGCFVTRQPIEWSLSQDSVGNFVDSGEPSSQMASCFLHTSSRKLSNDFVVTRTSTAPRVITRGTQTFDDDVWLKKGQGWVSITSATEGVSYVTTVAPGAENWKQRRQTATIYWIDAQWSFPGPAIASAGRPHALTTTVTRSSDGQPATNWVVRYEVVEGVPASFGRDSQTSIEVRTDANGQASAQLFPLTQGPGITQVRIQIISPNGGSTAGHVVGNGFTSVTWSAPGLAVQVSGPEHVAVDATATYRIEVSNPGDLPAKGVVVSAVIPPTLKFLTSEPHAERFEPRAQWRLGDMAPREKRLLEVKCRAVRDGNVRFCVEANGEDGLNAKGCADTQASMPALDVRFKEAPTEANVGDLIRYSVEVRNVGTIHLTDVVVRDRFDPGLEHRYGQASPIVRSLGDLEPGAISVMDVSFYARMPGRLCHSLDVSSAEGQSGVARACVDVKQPHMDVQLELLGPQQGHVGERADFTLRAKNTGDAPLTGVTIAFYAEPALIPRNATDGHKYQEGGITWTLDSLNKNQTVTLVVQCECLRVDDQAEVRMTFDSDQKITRDSATAMEILPAVAPPERKRQPDPGPTVPNAPPSTSGRLTVNIADTHENIHVGETTTYLVVIKNDRAVSDRNVKITFFLLEGLEYVDFDASGLDIEKRVSPDGRTIALKSIKEMRPNETLPPFRVLAKATKSGTARFRIEVSSWRSPESVLQEEDTTVQQD
ncbi:MAG: hypothetical protein ACC645_12640 [Pirellulales bacterium]